MPNRLEQAARDLVAQKDEQLRRFVWRIIVLVTTVVLIASTAVVLVLKANVAELHSLVEVVCDELLLDHRGRNERLHYAVIENERQLAEAIEELGGSDVEIVEPPRTHIYVDPEACRLEEDL
jgi:hypothetical protein